MKINLFSFMFIIITKKIGVNIQMENNLLIIFIILNILNVIIQTVKSLCTINGGKIVAAVANAVAYGFYTIVIIYMVCDLPLATKVVIVAICNFIGVFFVKMLEEKSRKEKLWKVEVTIPTEHNDEVHYKLSHVPHSYLVITDKNTLFNFYCSTKKESREVKKIIDNYHAKYFVSESKIL